MNVFKTSRFKRIYSHRPKNPLPGTKAEVFTSAFLLNLRMAKFTFLLLLLISLSKITQGQSEAIISGELANSTDSLKCVLQTDPITYESQTIFILPGNGKFKQEIHVEKPCFLYIKDGSNYIHGLIEPGDNVAIKYNTADLENSLSFEGKGKEKFFFLASFFRENIFQKPVFKEKVVIARGKQYPFDYLLNYLDSIENKYLTELDSKKVFLGNKSYTLLKALVQGRFLSPRYHAITDVYNESPDETLEKRKTGLSPNTLKAIQNLLKFDDSYSVSPDYANFVYNILFMHHQSLQLAHKESSDLISKYNYLNKILPGSLKVPVLTLFLDYDIGKLNQAEDLEAIIKKTYQLPKDSGYRNFIINKFKEITGFNKGKPAPEFTLENKKGEPVSLSSFRGKVVYMDFWYAACVPCHALFNYMKPAKEYFKNNENVVFLNISIDKREVWEKALGKYSIDGYQTFTQNKEERHEIIKAYKVAGYPTTCLVDRKGNIFAATPASNPEGLIKQIEDALKE